MGKYTGNSMDLIEKPHPLTSELIFVPSDHEFFTQEKDGKLISASERLETFRPGKRKMVLEAFAGVGILSQLYSEAGYTIYGIENSPSSFQALEANMRRFGNPGYQLKLGDNMDVLPSIETNHPHISIVDLDGYGEVFRQIPEAARILGGGLCFVTATDIFTYARFRQNRHIENRYGISYKGPWQEYPQKVIYRFVEEEFAKRNKKTKLVDQIAFKTFCRICVEVT